MAKVGYIVTTPHNGEDVETATFTGINRLFAQALFVDPNNPAARLIADSIEELPELYDMEDMSDGSKVVRVTVEVVEG